MWIVAFCQKMKNTDEAKGPLDNDVCESCTFLPRVTTGFGVN